MKVIILAAGIGKRFENHEAPKVLLRLSNEKSILSQQLESLSQYVHLDHVIIVVGYLQELIREVYPNLHFVENLQYETTNTAKSLLLGLDQVEDDDVLWLNGDVVFHPYVLNRMIAFGKTGMIVNTGQVGDEEIKYQTDGVGRIACISKHVQPASGEAIGINLFKSDVLDALKRNLARCDPDDYFEKAIQYCIDDAVDVWAVPVKDTAAVEVDFPEDLERANALIERWDQNLI